MRFHPFVSCTLLWLTLLSLLASCNEPTTTGNEPQTSPPVVPRFTLSLEPTTLTFTRIGEQHTVSLEVKRENSFDAPIEVVWDSSHLPSELEANRTIEGDSSLFTLHYQQWVASGRYNLPITVTAGTSKKSITLAVEIINPNEGAFSIHLIFGDGVNASQKLRFTAAAARWQQVITGDLPRLESLEIPAASCSPAQPAYQGAIDDLVIFADIIPIDGEGGILGGAGPCYVRTEGGLPFYGVMTFDEADVQGEDFANTILHEIGHVLGIGTLWTRAELVNYDDTACPVVPNLAHYQGREGVAAWQALGGSGEVPIEQDGDRGTACGHWDEEMFNDELMTGYSEANAEEPLSRLTIASLADLGYSVDYRQAQAYALPSCSPLCEASQPSARPQASRRSEWLRQPIAHAGVDGHIVPIPSSLPATRP